MSFLDLYMNKNPLITASGDGDPVATVFGIPFDSTHSYKPGCRFGPDVIRDAFNNIEIFHPDLGIDLETANIEDLGNTTHTVVASEMLDMVRKVTKELVEKNRQLFILGGEHLITYGTYMSFPKNTGYVVFDAHYDLRDEYADIKLSHASYLRRIVEERGAENILHVGARAFVKEELAFLKEHNIKTITDKEIRQGKGPQMLKDHVSSFDTLYTSLDLDVLDPAFAPGVGNPEAAGITSRELFDMIHSFENKKVNGIDIVELNPNYDNGATASLAAKVMSTLIALNLAQN
ncbi:MAG: agmatinase [Nitrosopumilaceae archaeon]|jgi:agmatinase|uniref:Agmatinase n=3 Tax=Candidatus Nitrosomaritimum aestuariumsis TaxID=3342354 RepID=A0AC60W2X9_9ARCH|nr:agmatinase [Nitrosopumilaceae archaeon]MBA4460182.1 agmatinase [Nitrosopumilaceae archaeon]MBA4462173.1 agmatinase [Nitrosopumilaceae archaeon]MBA4462705.1 agmatinase [Nitrosopumilaceae archaeon]NCF22383.1 agmatinase [Nitrosopumilaceae archaeon]